MRNRIRQYIKKQSAQGLGVALWPSIMAHSQCNDITGPLNRGYRPLVWLDTVIGARELDSTQIASTQDGGKAEINQRDESEEDNRDRGLQGAVQGRRKGEWQVRSKGQSTL